MRRISSKWTFFYKLVFPIVWFGFIVLFVIIALFVPARSGQSPPFPALIVPIIMAIIGYLLMKKLVFDLVDEVWEDRDALVVKNRGQEQRIALSDIKNVNYSTMSSPPPHTSSNRCDWRMTRIPDRTAGCRSARAMTPLNT